MRKAEGKGVGGPTLLTWKHFCKSRISRGHPAACRGLQLPRQPVGLSEGTHCVPKCRALWGDCNGLWGPGWADWTCPRTCASINICNISYMPQLMLCVPLVPDSATNATMAGNLAMPADSMPRNCKAQKLRLLPHTHSCHSQAESNKQNACCKVQTCSTGVTCRQCQQGKKHPA